MRFIGTSTTLAVMLTASIASCSATNSGDSSAAEHPKPTYTQEEIDSAEVAIFAGGCFWCMEPPFEKLDGVISVVSGYTGGEEQNPSYTEVSYGRTGHREAVEVRFIPSRISYRELLDVFWRSMDPTDAGGQFADRGTQYETAIFYHDDEQRKTAEASKADLEHNGPFDEPIVTPILAASEFWPAEEYHQDYYKKNPAHYQSYKVGSGRDGFLKRVWGDEAASLPAREKAQKPSDAELEKKLTPLQYRVTQQEGTEPPFDNEYWDNKRPGIYVDIVSGEPLFSSTDKFKSGTGWPSFTRPLVPDNIVEKTDYKIGYPRTEVRSKRADSHLGHVFDDGPPPTGLRYCINSAALRFVPKENLETEGYGEFAGLFATTESK